MLVHRLQRWFNNGSMSRVCWEASYEGPDLGQEARFNKEEVWMILLFKIKETEIVCSHMH